MHQPRKKIEIRGRGGGANPKKICNAYIMSIIVKKSWDVHGSWIYTYHQMKLTVTVSNEKKQNKVFKFNDPTGDQNISLSLLKPRKD